MVFLSAAMMASSTVDNLDVNLVAGKAALTVDQRVDCLVESMAVQKAVHLDQTRVDNSVAKSVVYSVSYSAHLTVAD